VVRLTQNRAGAFTAGALVVFGSVAFLPADGQAANFELFALLPASAAVLMVIVARSCPSAYRRALLFMAAGALVGLAGMIKQPFFAMLAPVGWEVWRARPRRAALVSTACGLVAAVLAIGLPFGLGAVWRWAWLDTGDYLGGKIDITRVVGMLALVAAMFTVLHLPTFSTIWSNRSRLRQVDPVIAFWTAGALIAVIPGFRFIAHYFELVVPPLAALTGILVAASLADGAPRTRGAARRHPLALLLISSAAIAVICTASATMSFANANQVRPELVNAIQSHSHPNDRILVWGALPETYWRAGRLPGERFLSAGYLTGKWADRPSPPHNAESLQPYRSRWLLFNQDLRAHPPTVVIDTSTADLDGWNKYAPDGYQFGTILTQCYANTGEVDHMTIWTLTDPACVRRLANGA